MPTATAAGKTATPKPVPVPNGDFYQLIDHLTPEEKAVVKKVRTYMETKVQPIINKYWSDDAFPFELLPSFKELGICGLGFEGYGCPGGSQKLFGFVAMESARDLSQWSRGAEAEMATANGARGKDRVFRVDRAAGRLGNERRNDHNRE